MLVIDNFFIVVSKDKFFNEIKFYILRFNKTMSGKTLLLKLFLFMISSNSSLTWNIFFCSCLKKKKTQTKTIFILELQKPEYKQGPDPLSVRQINR